ATGDHRPSRVPLDFAGDAFEPADLPVLRSGVAGVCPNGRHHFPLWVVSRLAAAVIFGDRVADFRIAVAIFLALAPALAGGMRGAVPGRPRAAAGLIRLSAGARGHQPLA